MWMYEDFIIDCSYGEDSILCPGCACFLGSSMEDVLFVMKA
jgi:hypothetical protein